MARADAADDPTAIVGSADPLVRWRRRARRGLQGTRDLLEMRLDPTYRRLAAGYRLPDGSRRVYLHHVRKTAGTSLFLSFLALGGEDPLTVWTRINGSHPPRTISNGYAFASVHRRLLADGHWFFGRAHRPVADQPLPAGTFTVTVLRDPVARVHSYYDYLVAGDAPDVPGRVAQRERRMTVGGFDGFLDQVPPRHLLSQLHTFSTSLDVSEAVDRLTGCSAVLSTEHFAAGLGSLGERLGLPLALHRARVTAERSTLTESQTERLRARLEPEYELLSRLSAAGVVDRDRPA